MPRRWKNSAAAYAAESALVRPILEANLDAQIDAFVELLRQEGLL
jgi:hypothetical protein